MTPQLPHNAVVVDIGCFALPDEKSMDIAYNKMFEAYKSSFDRIGLDYKIVKADTGVMGGLLSEEIQSS